MQDGDGAGPEVYRVEDEVFHHEAEHAYRLSGGPERTRPLLLRSTVWPFTVMGGMALLSLVGVTAWEAVSPPSPTATAVVLEAGEQEDDLPTPGGDSSPERLLAARPVPHSSSYRYSDAQAGRPGEPVAFDPCRPVHWVVNPEREPAGGLELLQRAVAQTSRATGLRFAYDGRTDEAWDDLRPDFQPERYGDRWAPVLVTWVEPPIDADDLDVAGQTLTSRRTMLARDVLVTAQVRLDAARAEELVHEDPVSLQVLVMHELGHAVGLDHVDDPAQVMHPQLSTQRHWGRGDLAGLAHAGRGECFPGL